MTTKRLIGLLTSPTLIGILILTLLWMLFFWRLLTPSATDRVVFPEGDFTQHYYAFSEYQVKRLAEGEFPLWNPYNHSGDPFAANIQFVAFYPPRLIAAALVGDDWSLEDYQMEVAVHYWLASLMMYAFLRVLIKKPSVALVGSVLYAYGGYLTGYPMLQVSVLESVIWFPLIMLGVHLSITRPGWTFYGCSIAGIGVALSMLGGHPQTTMHLTYASLAYLTFQTYYQKRPIFDLIWRAGLFGLIGAGLSAIQLLPAAEFTSLSYRVTQLGFLDKSNGFLAADFLQVIWPELFGVWSPLYLGVAGLILAVGSMLRPKPIHVFWMLVIALALFMSLGGNSIVFDFFYNVIPGFSIFRQQERIAAVMTFGLVVLATYQLDWLLSDEEETAAKRTFTWIAYGYVVFLVAVYVFGTVVQLLESGAGADDPTHATSVFGFVAVVGIMFAGWLTWIRNSEQRPVLAVQVAPLLLLLVIDLFTVGTRSENYLPDVPDNRVTLLPALQDFQIQPTDLQWRIDGAASLQGNGVLFSVPDIYGTGPFSLASIEELRRIPVDRFWEVLSVRYVTTFDEPPVDLVPMELLAYDVNYTGDEYRLFELQDPRPMAHLVYDYRSAEGSPEFARQIMSDSRVNLREMAVTLDPLPFELPVDRPELSEVRDFHFITPEKAEMTVSTSENTLLTLSIVNYPGWHATVNGESVEIIDTYAGLIGVPLQPGEDQRVRVEFMPRSVQIGAGVTALTALLVAAGFLWTTFSKRRKHH